MKHKYNSIQKYSRKIIKNQNKSIKISYNN